jgi:predicted metalloprotease with PDZ domain
MAGEVDQSLPTLDAKRARFDNNVTFVTPDGLSESPAKLEISAPDEWPVYTSWGKGESFSVPSIVHLISGAEIMGDYEYSQRKVGNTNVTFSILGDFNHNQIKEQFAKVFLAQQEIAGPFPFPQLLIIFQPWKQSEAKGTALTNALVVNIPPKLKLVPFNFQLMGTISHELFHQWNFAYIRPASEEGVYLFSEGFTNYFAVAALVKAKLIPEERFGRFLWRYKGFVESNPRYPSADFKKIQSGFSPWDENLSSLAYTKGPFVAVLLDLALREDTDGKQSLPSWFRLLGDRYGNKKGYSTDDLRALLLEAGQNPNGKSVQVFDEAFMGNKAFDFTSLMKRFGIICDRKDNCKLRKLSRNEAMLRSKVFSGTM